MDWTAFLEDFSDRVLRLESERDIFLALLSDANIGKSQQQVATSLSISKETVKTYMNAVYAAAGQEFPSVAAIGGRGKLKELRSCLKESWRKAPQPPILGEPSQEKMAGENVGAVQSPPELGDLGGEEVGRSTTGLKLGAPRLKRDDTAKKTILMLPASPSSRTSARWEAESTMARDVIKKADKNEDKYGFQERPFIKSPDLLENLTDLKPYVLHVSGDVEGIAELVLGNNTCQSLHDQNQQISELFRLHDQFIDCVILSGCSLEEQVQEIVHHIEFVIVLPKGLEQENAKSFLNGFYYSLPSNRGIKGSYDAGIYKLNQCLKEQSPTFDTTLVPKIFFRLDEINRREWIEELNDCIKELEKNPADINFWRKKADLLKKLGRVEEMNEAYEKAASIDPENYEDRVKQGDALESLGDHNKANVAYDKALKLEKEDYKIWWKKAIAQANIGEYNEADKSYKEALSIVSRFPWLVASPEVNSDKYVLCREHGNIVTELKRTRESIQSYRTSLWLEPNYRLANYEKKQAYKRFYSQSG